MYLLLGRLAGTQCKVDGETDPGKARGARAAACKSRDATTFGQSDCYKVCSLLRRDRHIKGSERTSAPAELAG